MFANQQILVTGGAGFVGSHLTAALVAQGAKVRVLDNLSSGFRENLHGLDVSFIEGDIADYEVVATAVSHCDLIFHQAALVSVPRSLEEPELNHCTNVKGTFNVLEAARQAGVTRVVYASSAAVYGDKATLPHRETNPVAPLTPYAAAKQINEVMAQTYFVAYGVETIGLRYMNVFGPRQDPSSPYSGVLSIFCQAALNNKTCIIHGDGEQTRDFIFVDDVVKANLLAAQIPAAQIPDPPVFNIGCGTQTSLNEIIDMLGQVVERPLRIEHRAVRKGDIRHSVADVGRAENLLGFDPQEAVLSGLQKTAAWFRSKSHNFATGHLSRDGQVTNKKLHQMAIHESEHN
ncbi:MAG: NAD-dependent epimerase/dehydratase family protein [Chloroflexi bacterium]|nr:NAD-dependent epimerase/dehydratase family protein [Chloroflexota bacterium]